MGEDTSDDVRSEQSGYSMGLRYGMAGAIVFFFASPLLAGLLFPRSYSFGPYIVAFACLSVVTGLAFGLAGLYWRPLSMRQAVVAAGVSLTFPVLVTLILALSHPVFLVLLLPTVLALCVISLASTCIPQLHRWCAVERGGVLSVEIRYVIVPAVTITLMIAVVTFGAIVLDDEHGSRCGYTHSGLGHSTTAVTPQASWAFTTANGSTEITHDGGDNIRADRMFVELNQSSIAWSRLPSSDDGNIAAGDTVTVPYSESGATLELVYRDASDDCEYKLGEHEIP